MTKETSLGKVPLMADLKKLLVSPDRRHLVYGAKRGSKNLIVVDGKESPEYEGTWPPLVFDGPQRIRFVPARFDESFHRELLRVEIEIVEEQA